MCRSLKVSGDAFYSWRAGRTYRLSWKKSELAAAGKEVFYLHRRRYGVRRISAELLAGGVRVGRRLAGSLMKAQDLTAIRPKRFVPKTTASNHAFGYSPNLLRDPTGEVAGQGEVMVGDITSLPLRGGKFCYLATFQDKFTRRIVGWQVSANMTAQLVIDAFNRARSRALIGRGADYSYRSRQPIRCGRISKAAVYQWLPAVDVGKGKLLRQCACRELLFQIQGGTGVKPRYA
jgi:putative transposase